MQNQDQNNLFSPVLKAVPANVLSTKNKSKTWQYGYNEKYDFVVISKSGQIQDVININGLKIALPKPPAKVYKRSKSKIEQYWKATEVHKELKRIQSIFQWHEAPIQFKNKWVDYIEEEFDKRDEGFWFMNNGVSNYPFFFKPIQDGMDKPKTELAYRVPASKITKKNMYTVSENDLEGLDTTIDWKNTSDNSYDGEKLQLLLHDESGKWERPENILNNWRVTKTCLRLGSKVIGKCMMGSTSNALDKGGRNFKDLFEASDCLKRNQNGQTKSGLYNLFIPMEWNMEGFIDRYGMPVFKNPTEKIIGIDKEIISQGAVDYWQNEVESLTSDPDALNEFYRQFPRTESHAFRDESKQSLFNLTKIYQQIDYNDSLNIHHHVTQGSFYWKDGIQDSSVIWSPNKRGRFFVTYTPKAALQNNVIVRAGKKYPGNEHIGTFGCDSYDISGVVVGKGSNGALHGLTKFNMDDAPSNEFFLEYIARPQTAEIFFEEVLMACIFYGMPILCENNKPRLLYHFKNRGYRGFCLNRPDKVYNKLSKTERELGGIPNTSEDVKQSHASAIESYIEKHVGLDLEGTYRDKDDMGSMYFAKTLEDWAKFDISNRTKFDASISSGLAIMANQKHLYTPVQKQSKISINFARYDNKNSVSQLLK